MSEKHKAYYVSDSSEEEGAIVYAKTNGDAKRRGANLFDDDWGGVSARRAPEWDGHYPHGPTDDEKWESGWHFECCICSCLAGKGYGLRLEGEAYCEDHMDVYAWRFREPNLSTRNPYVWYQSWR